MFIVETRTFEFQNVLADAEKPFNCSTLGQRSIVLDEQFLSHCISKGIISFIFFAGTADRNPSIRLAALSFFGSDWLNTQPKNSSLLTDATALSFSPLCLLAPLVHNSTC